MNTSLKVRKETMLSSLNQLGHDSLAVCRYWIENATDEKELDSMESHTPFCFLILGIKTLEQEVLKSFEKERKTKKRTKNGTVLKFPGLKLVKNNCEIVKQTESKKTVKKTALKKTTKKKS